MSDCIFCRIVKGEIPAAKIYENEEVLAFLDITQVTKGHTLVIPKKHCRNLLDMDTTTAENLFSKLPVIARHLKDTLGAEGLNVLNNNEEIAGQTVFHAHIHLLPRYTKEDGFSLQFQTNTPDISALSQLSQELFLGEDK